MGKLDCIVKYPLLSKVEKKNKKPAETHLRNKCKATIKAR